MGRLHGLTPVPSHFGRVDRSPSITDRTSLRTRLPRHRHPDWTARWLQSVRQGCTEAARSATWHKRICGTVSGGFDCKDPRRGERDQSAEDGPRAEPTGVRHRVENQAGGRRNHTRDPTVGVRGLLDAAAAAWTALRRHRGESSSVCTPERDAQGLEVTICY
jgi:hypothetical protein